MYKVSDPGASYFLVSFKDSSFSIRCTELYRLPLKKIPILSFTTLTSRILVRRSVRVPWITTEVPSKFHLKGEE